MRLECLPVRGNFIDKKGFIGKIILSGIVFIVLFYIFITMVTYDASSIRRKISKVDGQAVLIIGRVTEVKAIPEISAAVGGYFGFKLKTRKGEIWVITTKDKPSEKDKMFMEVEVLGTVDTMNRRLKPAHPFPKSGKINDMLPIAIEKSRLSVPVVI
ncbi:MAG: hypothetical protein QMC67_09910 [Candidatus Wallbacteria bacterium]